MTTLIDTSAWIEFLRPNGDPLVKSRVADLITLHAAAYTCPVRFELLLGARPHEVPDLTEALDLARRIPLEPFHWDAAATHGATLRCLGISIPASDLLIATVAVSTNIPLLARDQHFPLLHHHCLPQLRLL